MIERNKEYFWQSPKDGAFHTVKLNSINKQGNYNMKVLERIHDGWLTTNFTQSTGVIVTIPKEEIDDKLYADFGPMEVDYMFRLVDCSESFEFEKTLYFYRDFLELLYDYPDKYIKYIDKLLSNQVFKDLVDGKYKLRAS